jgi:hypothetical protein
MGTALGISKKPKPFPSQQPVTSRVVCDGITTVFKIRIPLITHEACEQTTQSWILALPPQIRDMIYHSLLIVGDVYYTLSKYQHDRAPQLVFP